MQKPETKQDIALQTLPLRYLILPLTVGLCRGDGLPSSLASKSTSHADPGPCHFLSTEPEPCGLWPSGCWAALMWQKQELWGQVSTLLLTGNEILGTLLTL